MISTRKRIAAAIGTAAIFTSLLMAATPAYALSIVPECALTRGTPGQAPDVPSLNCALQTFGNIAQLILGVTGSFALLMFVYGGFTLLTSGGSSDKVSKGKTIITNAVIGIVIIFASGALITYGMSKVGVKGAIAGQPCAGGGTYYMKPDGKIACVTKCEDIGYTCTDSKSTAGLQCVPVKCSDATKSCCH